MKSTPYRSLAELIIERAGKGPDHTALIFITEDGAKVSVTAAEMYNNALRYARALQCLSIGQDDLVMLVLPHCLELVYAFWGTILLGAIPTIYPYPTSKMAPDIYGKRLQHTVSHVGARMIITLPDISKSLSGPLAGEGCRVVGLDEILAHFPENNPLAYSGIDHGGNRPALLIHSSGSSGPPKSIMFTHNQILMNTQALNRATDLNSSDVLVSWLPLHHDMGLYAGLIIPGAAAIPVVLMSPFYWTRSPITLLQAIHEHKGTLTWMPNFAYSYCAHRIRDRDLEGLDLSGWRMAVNVAEPVRHDSHRLFVERFAPCGFHSSALATGYGMTENGGVTISPPGQAANVDWVDSRSIQEKRLALPASPQAPEARPIVSCGGPIPGVDLKIVDDDGRGLPERHIGEIVIRSPFLFNGYYNRPELTAQVFDNDWYCTADMGYVAGNQLYVCGRKHDLIMSGGKNIYPQDLEDIATTIPGIYPGRAVAFGVMNEQLGTENLVLVCELRDEVKNKDMIEIERILRRRVAQELDATLADARLIKEKGWVIKTPGGKVAREANRTKYLKMISR